MSCPRTPFAMRMFIIGAVLPSIGEVRNSCVKYCRRNVRREGGIVENVWLKSSVHIGMGQCAERVILIPSSIPIEPFEFCQVFSEVGHFLMGIAEMLNFPL